jgi:hypothetical protein
MVWRLAMDLKMTDIEAGSTPTQPAPTNPKILAFLAFLAPLAVL